MWPFRRRRMSEAEFLRHVMQAVTGHEIKLEPPRKLPPLPQLELGERAVTEALRELRLVRGGKR